MRDSIKIRRCNKCGEEFNIWDEHANLNIKKPLGYGSSYDGETIDLFFCYNCMDKIIDSCVISPIITDSDT